MTIFKGLTREELDRVVGIMGMREFKRNEVIFLEGDAGDCFYLVLTGEVRIFKLSPDGREKTLALIGEGDFFGEMALIDSKARSASAGALTKAKLAVLHRDHFNALIYEHPEIALKMIVQLAERLRRANQQIESLAFQDVRERLIQFILQYATLAEDGSCVVARKVTHQEIANLIGSSRESVTRMLGQLQDEGYITFDGKIIVIQDRERLEDLIL
jgi:CRP/FNR family transcriptional regulator